MRIETIPPNNPHREGSDRWQRFELFKKHKTVGAWRKAAIAAGLADTGRGHLSYAVRMGLVRVT